jgi:hypothetical protein
MIWQSKTIGHRFIDIDESDIAEYRGSHIDAAIVR